MKKLMLAFLGFSAALTVSAAVVDSVTAKQDWPWSTDIKVKYVLSSVSAPVDLKVSAIKGTVETEIPKAAITGNTYAITAEGAGELVINPAAAFGTDQVALTDLKIKLTVTDTANDPEEALYRIYDLDDGTYTNVTRRALLNGDWGTIETSFSALDPNFTTTLDDVLIWTGVTNNSAYKTNKLVMRKIHAKDVVWQSGDPDDVAVNQGAAVARHWIKLGYDYYIAVFETTQAQFKKIYGSLPTDCVEQGNEENPVNYTCRYYTMGYPYNPPYLYAYGGVKRAGEWVVFPTNSYVRDVGKATFLSQLWTKTKCEFTLPTGAEWEYACRGGNDGVLYSGESQTEAHVRKIASCAENCGGVMYGCGKRLPNAFGLYDMLGNVMEHVNYSGSIHDGAISGTGDSEADPAVSPLSKTNTTKDTTYYVVGGSYYNRSRFGAWEDCRPTCRCGSYNAHYQSYGHVGFRVVAPVTGEWGADWPKTVLEEEEEIVAEDVGTLYLGDQRAATAGAGKADTKILAYDEATTGDLLATLDKGILKTVNPTTVELFIGYNNTLKAYDDETPLDTVIGVREIATKLRAAYPSATIWINPMTYDDVDTEAQKVRKYAINRACVEINEGNSGKMFMRQPDWMYVYPAETNPWPGTTYISKYWLSNASNPRLKLKLAEKRSRALSAYDCVMVGDSVTHFWEDVNGKDYFAANIANKWNVFNLGFGGDCTYHTVWNLLYSGLFDNYTASVITLLIGNNNITETSTDEDLAKVAADCKRIIDIMKANHPESKIVLFPLLPKGNDPGVFRTLHSKYNALIETYADGTTVVWAGELWDEYLATADANGVIPKDVLCDGCHPGTRGYQIWGDILKTYLPTKE